MKLIDKYLITIILIISLFSLFNSILLRFFNFGFLLLTLSFIFLLYSVASKPNIFKILISLLLFLGIWLKYFVRSLLTPGEFNDPVGHFNYSSNLVSEIFINIAFIIFLISFIFNCNYKSYNYNISKIKINLNFNFQIIIIFSIFLILFVNYFYEIDYRGLNTHSSGFWIYFYKYFIHILSPIFIFTFIDKNYVKDNLKFPFLCLFLFLYAMSINSRSFVFEGFLLLIFFISKFGDFKNYKKYLIFFLLYLILAITNFYYVNSTRYAIFLSNNNLQLSTESTFNDVKTYIKKTSENVGYYSLFIDRWVGLEPIFAIYSYPNKSIETFKDAILEKKDSNISFYDSKIIHDSTYLETNNNNIFYQNIPGIIGFSLYPGNLFITLIFIGLIFYSLCFLLGSINSGFFSTYIVSFMIAWRISHFGYAPLFTFYYLILIFLTYYFLNKSLKWKR